MAQDQPPESRHCPVCGADNAASARYCSNCGARLGDPPTSFTQTLAEVVPATTTAPSTANEAPTPVPTSSQTLDAGSASATAPSVAPAWTASTAVWTGAAGTSDTTPTSAGVQSIAPAPPKKGVGRTIWIVLGILAFIVLFCCIASIVLVAVSSRDSAFQNQVSMFAQARR